MKTSSTPTSRVVVDSWAWVEYFDGSPKGRKVEEFIAKKEVWTSAVSIAEITSRYRRKRIDEGLAMDTLFSITRVGTLSSDDAQEAGRIHAEVKPVSPNFSLADSFVLQLARKLGCKVLTGDPDFRKIVEAEFIS